MDFPSIHRPSYVEINLNNIKKNIKNIQHHLKNNEDIFAVVKADAYSHGLVEVSRAAIESGVTGLCVATLDEALTLREASIIEPILVLGVTDAKYAPLAAQQNISLTVASKGWLAFTQNENFDGLKVHIKIDSGMGRIGITKREELLEACDILKKDSRFISEGIFTHFATADEPDDTYFQYQLDTFKKITKDLPINFKYKHVANSATTLWRDDSGFNMIRLGIAMYGLNPSGTAIDLPYEIKPAFSLQSEIVFVKKVKPKTKIGYGATYEAPEEEWIATVPIGYADGWLRRMQGFEVLVDGNRCPIVGRVCMDQLMIKLPGPYVPGTKVTLLGQNGDDEVSIQEAADYADTINYEIICSLSSRLPRIYK
ncbi:alanine racemase [Companilactobacillus sp. DQM5]|uniref:alanine racemase n=1 Tax=Companilactobacillus sp. DQM5 TaxID=3463359 RepID=UPI004058C0C3